jgi:hypothetical protein
LCIYLIYNVEFCVAKGMYWADPHHLDVWQPAHRGNADAAEKLVSISFYSYESFVIFVLNSIFYMTDIHRS